MQKKTALFSVLAIVFVDLLGFGMVIPLIALYGHEFGASRLQLAVLGSAYSLLQFIFAPLWSSLSDRYGRRPILLLSLFGSSVSYLVFGLAHNYYTLLLSRAFAGVFAANISTAQAYVADVTGEQERTKGMGLVGAAIGLGFTFGPPLGGLSAKFIGLSAPGFIAAAICFSNLVAAWFFLTESLGRFENSKGVQSRARRGLAALGYLRELGSGSILARLILIYFAAILAFSHMEQVFSLFLEHRLDLSPAEAGFQGGMLMLSMGLIGVLIQGGLIRGLSARFGEWRLVLAGAFLCGAGMASFTMAAKSIAVYLSALPVACGSSLLQPAMMSLISKHAAAGKQGATFGLAQGLSSLARVIGPFTGLMFFDIALALPFAAAGIIYLLVFAAAMKLAVADA